MIKIENVEVVGWEHAIRGMRNPMNSWDKSDSEPGCEIVTGSHELCRECDYASFIHGERVCDQKPELVLGYNDRDLMKKLRNAGTDHRKYMRMITVYLDVTAPLYWWKEFDTYKVGTVANSCSTMHKITEKEFTLEDFSCEHLFSNDDMLDYDERSDIAKDNALAAVNVDGDWCYFTPHGFVQMTCNILNHYRQKYLECAERLKYNNFEDWHDGMVCKDDQKKYWWQIIQLLPSSYNQKRTIMLNYEVLANMYKSRKAHKLDEWRAFCGWIESLPYSELITGEEE